MKNNIEQLLHIAADSSSFEMNDALSFLVGAVQQKYSSGIHALSDDELENVAGGVSQNVGYQPET